MAKKQVRRPTPAPSVATPFDQARDELFQQIMQCGVIGAAAEDQSEWFEDTMRYLSDRYHELSPQDLKQLRVLGDRFVQPPKSKASEEAVTAA
jgi:hypothetical protein